MKKKPHHLRNTLRVSTESINLQKEQRYLLGETFTNPYLGNKIIEVLDLSRQRVGWLWQTAEGKTIVSPHLGMYIWFAEGGVEWTQETGAKWLVINTTKKIEREA